MAGEILGGEQEPRRRRLQRCRRRSAPRRTRAPLRRDRLEGRGERRQLDDVALGRGRAVEQVVARGAGIGGELVDRAPNPARCAARRESRPRRSGWRARARGRDRSGRAPRGSPPRHRSRPAPSRHGSSRGRCRACPAPSARRATRARRRGRSRCSPTPARPAVDHGRSNRRRCRSCAARPRTAPRPRRPRHRRHCRRRARSRRRRGRQADARSRPCPRRR